MKKEFVNPEIQFISFETQDIVTASGCIHDSYDQKDDQTDREDQETSATANQSPAPF